MSSEKILSHFKKDTSEHEMKILLDDGFYRHINFSRGDSSSYHFNLVTWPGYLTIAGDCGTFTFCRSPDMFGFFRMRDSDFNKRKDGELSINPHYWQEKIQAGACSGKAISEEFSIDKFKKNVGEWFNDRCPKKGGELTRGQRKEAWEDVKSQVLDIAEDEWSAVTAIRDFNSEIFDFGDFWEVDHTEYKSHYIWCLYAIVWGINEYDKFKAESTAGIAA